MAFRLPPYNITDLAKMRTLTTVPFKRNETIADQLIGGNEYRKFWQVAAFGAALAIGGVGWKKVRS